MAIQKPVKIVVPGDYPIQIAGSPYLKRLEDYGEILVYKNRPDTVAEKIKRARDADILINSRGSVTWGPEEFRQLPNLKMITSCSIGTDMFDLEYARNQGIVICNQPGRTAGVVAEHMFGLMFAVAKRAAFMTSEMKAGKWPRMDNIMLQGKVLGIIGLGNIGAEMARLGKAIGMKVVSWTYHPSTKRAEALGTSNVDLDHLLKMSQVVSLHIKLTDDSRGMIGAREFGLMQPGTLLLNGARGPIVDTDALVEALNSGHIGGAGIDVYEEEPTLEDHPLFSCKQVVLTPHCADMTPEGVDLLNEGAVQNVIAFLEGKLQNVVE